MTVPSSTLRPASTLWLLLVSLRPKQWTKNLLLFLPFLFTINVRWDPAHLRPALETFGQVAFGFVLFCLLSSALYILNDIVDRENDQRHLVKRLRPIPSGALSLGLAGTASGILGVTALAVSLVLSPLFGIVALVYAALSMGYSLCLKQIVIVDVLAIAAGFVLRAVAGAIVIDVPISPWLYICATLGALFLACGKRRNELLALGQGSAAHREALKDYSPALLDQMIAVITPSLLISYSLYTFSAPNLPKNNAMMLTIPFVVYGIFRYLYLMHIRNLGGSPEDILLSDRPLLVAILLWAATAGGILLAFR